MAAVVAATVTIPFAIEKFSIISGKFLSRSERMASALATFGLKEDWQLVFLHLDYLSRDMKLFLVQFDQIIAEKWFHSKPLHKCRRKLSSLTKLVKEAWKSAFGLTSDNDLMLHLWRKFEGEIVEIQFPLVKNWWTTRFDNAVFVKFDVCVKAISQFVGKDVRSDLIHELGLGEQELDFHRVLVSRVQLNKIWIIVCDQWRTFEFVDKSLLQRVPVSIALDGLNVLQLFVDQKLFQLQLPFRSDARSCPIFPLFDPASFESAMQFALAAWYMRITVDFRAFSEAFWNDIEAGNVDILTLILENRCVFFLSLDFVTNRTLMEIWNVSRILRIRSWVIEVDPCLDEWPSAMAELKIQEVCEDVFFGSDWTNLGKTRRLNYKKLLDLQKRASDLFSEHFSKQIMIETRLSTDEMKFLERITSDIVPYDGFHTIYDWIVLDGNDDARSDLRMLTKTQDGRIVLLKQSVIKNV
jgi:hypothetical protein